MHDFLSSLVKCWSFAGGDCYGKGFFRGSEPGQKEDSDRHQARVRLHCSALSVILGFVEMTRRFSGP